MRILRTAILLPLASLLLARGAAAQEAVAVPPGPPLGGFTAMKVSITPVQTWNPDSAGWSRSVVWATTRLALDSALQAELEDRGLAKKWAYASDMVRTARRNPTYAGDPYSLGVARLRTAELKVGMAIPQLMADNLRPFTALNDTRYALIPVSLRVEGEGVILRIVLVDTRSRTLTWAGELVSPGGARMVPELATRIANLIIEP
jgi:hypothetical protein